MTMPFSLPNDSEKINEAIAQGHKYWGDDSLNDIKSRIKAHLRERQQECCCYCCRNSDGEFKMVLDIEHIIPKSRLVSQMFELRNLAVSCKRCNMNLKGEDISFIVGSFNAFISSNDFYHSFKYKFLHPNLDDWDDHLIYELRQVNRKKIVYYHVVNGSEKGKYTKKYFDLEKIQANTFDEAQAASSRKEPSDPIASKLFNAIIKRVFGK